MLEIASKPLGAQLAVVRQADLDEILDAGSSGTLAASAACGSDRVMPSTCHLMQGGGMDRQAPPAAADIEEPLARLQRELAADELALGRLGFVECLRARLPVGAAIGHRVVQELLEEVVADVVVVANGQAVAGQRVAFTTQPQLGGGPARRWRHAESHGSARRRAGR